jgi:hypothetical protein
LVDPDNEAYSFSLTVTNEYASHKLTIYALDEERGALLPGMVLKSYAAADPDTPIKEYTTESVADAGRKGKPGRRYHPLSLKRTTISQMFFITSWKTDAPDGYLFPSAPEKIYFYFSGESASVPAGLPEGASALDLSTSYKTVTISNSTIDIHIPVIIAWGLAGAGTWPAEVDHVTVQLYRSVDGADAEAVEGKSVSLNAGTNYDNGVFSQLPTRDEDGKNISYFLVEKIYGDTRRDTGTVR